MAGDDGGGGDDFALALNIVAQPAAPKATKRKCNNKYDRRRKRTEEQKEKNERQEHFQQDLQEENQKQQQRAEKSVKDHEEGGEDDSEEDAIVHVEKRSNTTPVRSTTETLEEAFPEDYTASSRKGGHDEDDNYINKNRSKGRAALPQDEEERARYLAEFHARPLELDRRSHALKVAHDKPDSQHLFSETTVWSQFKLHPRIVQSIVASGLIQPTLIQARAIPAFFSPSTTEESSSTKPSPPQHNILLHSETGSGKTLAYLLPILQSLAVGMSSSNNDQLRRMKDRVEYGTRCLILCPTRELAAQTFATLEQLCTSTFNWIVPGCLLGSGGGNSGDVNKCRKAEKTRLRKGLGMIVATPGRLLDHLSKTESLLMALKGKLEWVVLDEADRLLDMGLGDQVKQIVQRITANQAGGSNTAWRSVLVSATVTPSVQQLAEDTLAVIGNNSWVWVKANGNGESGGTQQAKGTGEKTDNKSDDEDDNGLADSTPRQLAQWHMMVSSKWRLSALIALLVQRVHQQQRTVVFFDTKASVDFHYALFNAIDECIMGDDTKNNDDDDTTETRGIFGKHCTIHKLHGSVPHSQRQLVLKQFLPSSSKKGAANSDKVSVVKAPKEAAILFATDVAARGLNLQDCDWTVQYDPPSEISDYVHRAGRVARAGRAGHSLLFLLPSEREFLSLLQKRGVSKLSALSLSATLNAAAKLCPKLSKQGIDRAGGGLGTSKDGRSSSRLGEAFSSELQRRLEDCVVEDDAQARAAQTAEKKNKKKGRVVVTGGELMEMASTAFLSHIRAYPTREKCVKHIFAAKALHLGHLARSFALKDAPKRLASKTKHSSSESTTRTTTTMDHHPLAERKRNASMAFQKQMDDDHHRRHHEDEAVVVKMTGVNDDDDRSSPVSKKARISENKINDGSSEHAMKKSKKYGVVDPKKARLLMMENAKKLQGMDAF